MGRYSENSVNRPTVGGGPLEYYRPFEQDLCSLAHVIGLPIAPYIIASSCSTNIALPDSRLVGPSQSHNSGCIRPPYPCSGYTMGAYTLYQTLQNNSMALSLCHWIVDPYSPNRSFRHGPLLTENISLWLSLPMNYKPLEQLVDIDISIVRHLGYTLCATK